MFDKIAIIIAAILAIPSPRELERQVAFGHYRKPEVKADIDKELTSRLAELDKFTTADIRTAVVFIGRASEMSGSSELDVLRLMAKRMGDSDLLAEVEEKML